MNAPRSAGSKAKIKARVKVSTGLKAFKVEGVPELKKTINEIAKTLSGEGAKNFVDRVSQICLKPAILIRDNAVANAPRGKTGKLKGSIYAEVVAGHVGAEVGTRKCFYAPFVEYGTSVAKAHPYLRPALKAQRPVFAAGMAADLRALIEDVTAANAAHPPVST